MIQHTTNHVESECIFNTKFGSAELLGLRVERVSMNKNGKGPTVNWPPNQTVLNLCMGSNLEVLELGKKWLSKHNQACWIRVYTFETT